MQVGEHLGRDVIVPLRVAGHSAEKTSGIGFLPVGETAAGQKGNDIGQQLAHGIQNYIFLLFPPFFYNKNAYFRADIFTGMQLFGNKKHLDTREKDWIEEAKKGDRRAQKAIYDLLAAKMFAVCLRYMGDRDSAEDILQDGFVTLFSKIDSFTGAGSFEGWARRIFVNTALMSLRKKDALKNSEDVQSAWGISSDSPTAIEEIGYDELMKMIAALPPGFRTVFNMYVIEGYSHKEIAEALGISETTSRSQLQRARTLLQSKIKERY